MVHKHYLSLHSDISEVSFPAQDVFVAFGELGVRYSVGVSFLWEVVTLVFISQGVQLNECRMLGIFQRPLLKGCQAGQSTTHAGVLCFW